MKKGGRIAGTPNKLTATIRERIELIFNDCINDLQLNELSNREKIELATKLLPFLIPKYATIIENHPSEKTNAIKTIYITDEAVN
jgi:hypothetical protein